MVGKLTCLGFEYEFGIGLKLEWIVPHILLVLEK